LTALPRQIQAVTTPPPRIRTRTIRTRSAPMRGPVRRAHRLTAPPQPTARPVARKKAAAAGTVLICPEPVPLERSSSDFSAQISSGAESLLSSRRGAGNPTWSDAEAILRHAGGGTDPLTVPPLHVWPCTRPARAEGPRCRASHGLLP